MKIAVLLNEEPNGSRLRKIATPYGEACVVVESLTVPLGTRMDAELDVNCVVGAASVRSLSEHAGSGIQGDSSQVILSGLVEQIDPDGMCFFRIGPDCLVMVEFEVTPEVGKRLELLLSPLDVSASFS